jgi:predicted secreted Zn-dependent protease
MIIYNAKKNFISKDFKHLAIIIGITTKIVLVEAHWLIRKVECYYTVLSKELPDLDKEMAL